MLRLAQGSLVTLAMLVAACAVSDGSYPGAGVSPSILTDGDADACEQDCDNQAAAGCERMPPDWAASCKLLLCAGLRSSTPAQCQAALRAQSQCAVDRVMYSCSNGIVAVMPQGICAAEARVCASCRGSLCIPGL